jgi:hemoglobin
MQDIQTQEDLYLLVGEFYKKLLSDKSIGYIFTDIVKTKIEEHLPILVTFWSQVILGTGGYTNNLTQIHLDINQKEYLSPELFTIWLKHFNTIVNEFFVGEKAEQIKTQALSIAKILQVKTTLQNNTKK